MSILKLIVKWVILSGWVAGVSILIFWHWFDDPVIITRDFNRALAPVSQKSIDHNGSLNLRLHIDFCQTREIVPGSVQRSITNAVKYFLADTSSVLGVGCHEGDRIIMLPPGLVLGPHLYHFEALYWVNPIKNKKAVTGPVAFEVVP